jgi:hypothetical protein
MNMNKHTHTRDLHDLAERMAFKKSLKWRKGISQGEMVTRLDKILVFSNYLENSFFLGS